jgi:hypothetical protein
MTARLSKHEQHRLARGVSTPCAAWHGTFGGRCLNCGYTPGRIVEDVIKARQAERAEGIK